MHVLNGVIQQEFAGQPFLRISQLQPYSIAHGNVQHRVGSEFSRTLDLGFDRGLDLGFTALSVAGDAQAILDAKAGIELTVGFDVDGVGTGQTIGAGTLLKDLDQGRGVQIKVGLSGTPVNQARQRSTPRYRAQHDGKPLWKRKSSFERGYPIRTDRKQHESCGSRLRPERRHSSEDCSRRSAGLVGCR